MEPSHAAPEATPNGHELFPDAPAPAPAAEHRITIAAPFDDQFPDVPERDKVFWQFVVPKSFKDGDVVRVILPSKLELLFEPPPGTSPGVPLAFLVPLAETLRREVATAKKPASGTAVLASHVAEGAVRLARKVSFGRKSSFGRARRRREGEKEKEAAPATAATEVPEVPVFIEVDFYKKDEATQLGISLASFGRGHPPREGVLIAKVEPDSLVARKGKMRAGDLLHAVNGIKTTSHQQAVGLLRSAVGVIQCMITRAGPLPEGWEQKIEKKENNRVYFLHKEQLRWSYLHPLAIDMDVHGNLFSRKDKETMVMERQGEVQTYRDGLQAMSTRARMIEMVQDEEAGLTIQRNSTNASERNSLQLETTSV